MRMSRWFIAGLAAAVWIPSSVLGQTKKRSFQLDPKFEPQSVPYESDLPAGSVVVDPKNRFLYLIESPFSARRYGIGVGRAGLAWSGKAVVGRKAAWPRWIPTDDMITRDPAKYGKYAVGVDGGPENPLGARAIYLYRDGRDTYYRIHGTNEPWTIGTAVSNGCIRMTNDHVISCTNMSASVRRSLFWDNQWLRLRWKADP
ncbi:L,D-transpeptidase-like protein [Phyllobacterium bourgognense]|uniref:L,D-transpeptidase-like protein n=1 Tax=Phyllobacterium bourgognense TaxID=314236 RepID=A0A368YDC8_9HYPH|nr:L,D-transpeptidase-like protein [Phyllobacterium bourgognense]